MRRFLTAFAAAVLMLSLGTANAAEYKKMTIRAATANPQGSLHVVAIDKFKEIVEKESNGAITVQTFYGGSLGDEQANVKQLRNAEIHLAVLADGNLTPFAPQAGVFILPYMFPKISDAEKLFGNEAFMNKTADAIAKQSRTRPLSWLVGGYRIIKAVGMDMVKLEKYQGFSADLSAALCLLLSSLFGIPVSTTHTKTSAIMGVGAVKRITAINFGVVKDMMLTWVFTFPGCGLISFVMAKLFMMIL